MAVYQDRRNGRFFIQFCLHGETYKERLPKSTTRKEAERLEIKTKSRILFEQHDIYESRKDQTFERFIQDVYLPYVESSHSAASFERAIAICKAALPFLKGKSLRSVKPADIERFKQARFALETQHSRPRKPATVLRELSIISKIFSMAVQNDLCPYNPCSRIQKPTFDNVQNTILRREDEAAFFAGFDKWRGGWASDICKVVLHTGLRQNDVLGLKKFNLDFNNRIIGLVQGKTQRRHEIPMTETVYEILLQRSKRPGSLLFPSPKNGRQAKSVRTAIFNACRRAGIAKLTIRDLRRTCATRLDEDGFSSATIAKYLGHTDLRSVYRYQRGVDILREAANSLENNGQSAPSVPNAKLKIVK